MDWLRSFFAQFNTGEIYREIEKRKDVHPDKPLPPPSYGYEFYPERKGEKYDPSIAKMAFLGEGREGYKRHKCEMYIYDLIKRNPTVKLLIGALNDAGCPVDIRRHFSCEVCDTRITGGYDPSTNQIVVCQNTGKSKWKSALIHELIHMYDNCANKVDFTKMEHLACTEIRAANLTHCSFLSSFMLGTSTPFNISQTHQNCVKLKAAQSVMVSRTVDFATAMGVVLKVFDKCYNDLEPVGRRCRRNSDEGYLSYKEGIYYGYVEDDGT